MKNIPSPCCGDYGVMIESNLDDGKLWYRAKCPSCGIGTDDWYDSRQEAVYEYEKMCIGAWKRNRNGLSDWMKKKPGSREESLKRQQIAKDMTPYVMGLK